MYEWIFEVVKCLYIFSWKMSRFYSYFVSCDSHYKFYLFLTWKIWRFSPHYHNHIGKILFREYQYWSEHLEKRFSINALLHGNSKRAIFPLHLNTEDPVVPTLVMCWFLCSRLFTMHSCFYFTKKMAGNGVKEMKRRAGIIRITVLAFPRWSAHYKTAWVLCFRRW